MDSHTSQSNGEKEPTIPDNPGEAEEGPLLVGPSKETYLKVILGQVVDPLFPPHPDPPETSEDELTRAAMEDPAGFGPEAQDSKPTLWRIVTLLSFAVLALGLVFWWRR